MHFLDVTLIASRPAEPFKPNNVDDKFATSEGERKSILVSPALVTRTPAPRFVREVTFCALVNTYLRNDWLRMASPYDISKKRPLPVPSPIWCRSNLKGIFSADGANETISKSSFPSMIERKLFSHFGTTAIKSNELMSSLLLEFRKKLNCS